MIFRVPPLPLRPDNLALHPGAEHGAAGGDQALVDASPADLAGQSAILDLGATIHDHAQSGGFGLAGRDIVDDAELHPDDLKAKLVLQRERLARHLEGRVRVAEDVDHVDGRLKVLQ
jgi:hypothetical protein